MTPELTRKEVSEHNTNKSCWFVIGNKVYDVSKFLDEHPGGCEVLLEQAGLDATEAFEDVGHSTDARAMKDEYFVGDIVEEEKQQYSYDKRTFADTGNNRQRGQSSGGFADQLIMPALIAVIVALVYYLFLA